MSTDVRTDSAQIVCFERAEAFLGAVRGITLPATRNGREQVTFELNIVDGWTRKVDEWDEYGVSHYWPDAHRARFATVLAATEGHEAARAHVIAAHIAWVRTIRSAAVMGGPASATLHARAARQARALVAALAAQGRALVNVDVMDPRKDASKMDALAA